MIEFTSHDKIAIIDALVQISKRENELQREREEVISALIFIVITELSRRFIEAQYLQIIDRDKLYFSEAETAIIRSLMLDKRDNGNGNAI